MKLKVKGLVLAMMCAGAMSASAASFIITNANDGTTDTLYANKSNVLMNGGIVGVGYFPSTTTPAMINTIPGLVSNLGSFTVVTSIAPGSFSGTLGGSFPGYADQFPTTTSIGAINVGNPLFGRSIYLIVSSASSFATSTSSSEYALFSLGALTGDTPVPQTIVGSPNGVPIIGTKSTKTGNFGGQGSSTFPTLLTATNAIPEPSSLLLGMFGALGLLRRRRN